MQNQRSGAWRDRWHALWRVLIYAVTLRTAIDRAAIREAAVSVISPSQAHAIQSLWRSTPETLSGTRSFERGERRDCFFSNGRSSRAFSDTHTLGGIASSSFSYFFYYFCIYFYFLFSPFVVATCLDWTEIDKSFQIRVGIRNKERQQHDPVPTLQHLIAVGHGIRL